MNCVPAVDCFVHRRFDLDCGLVFTGMDLYPLDDSSLLNIGPEVDDWAPVLAADVRVVVDLDGDLDVGVDKLAQEMLYLFFVFDDDERLPDVARMHQIARFLAGEVKAGRKVLIHCAMGHNRSALLAGVVLYHLEFPPAEIVHRIQARRQGALYNRVFRSYLESLATTPAVA